ncbi:hypothetical protein AGDE_13289 [Angomonas deanei]|uniref:Phosphatidylinositol 3- and 4-kinase/FATC domain containing protein, putative n=1 Tax=Angomonas deanei TaxID=59799 RepID=A0A7G2C3T2_9TRYP|nr:hypothetical protein AGDE_13289 [Angomonas deanei]CAD2214448.1 Phosphatidylinositol 3- and 4-kinase/FATC domain containing protein, putative [Angomonas deanei]|eukprot:EPY22477.1 hypothetical protein AGDE_13289 [Angomonas deanei]
MMKTNKPNIPDDVVAHLGEWFASSELALTVSPMGHLLGSPASHGGLKELLLRTRDNIKPYLRQEEGAMLQLLSVTARERMFSILFNVPWGAASAGAMEQVLTDISPYMGKMDAATVRQIRSDYAYCCVSLNLHTSSSDSETVYRDHEALLTELADIAKDSAPATVVYLGLLDRFLTQGVDEESVWLAYATTLLSALQVYGNATFIPGTEDRDGVIPMYCIPHLLQLFAFDFSKKAAFATSAEWAPVVEGLLRLPSSIWAPWTSQIITSVLQCQHVVVAKVLLQLAQQQPQTVFYPYNCAMGEFHQLSQQGDPTLRPVVEELYRVLQEEARLDRLRGFVRELCRVSHPLQLLRLFMERIQLNFASFIKTGEEAYYQLAVKDLEEGRRTIGKSGCCETEKISWGEAQRIEELFEGLVDANSKSLSRDKTVVWGQLKKMHAAIQSKPRERPRALVTDYTAKLPSLLFPASSSPTEGLRLPCQPLLQLNQPDTDVHLIGVHPHMDVMSSLQAPRRLTFYTTQQSYDVLLKCNEDMRLDQRIQDVFFICSSLLQREGGTTSTSLYLRTYSVVPLTDKVGLIQWVPHTTTFNDLINTVMQHRTGARLNMELPVMKEYVQRYYRAVDSKRVLLSYTKDPNGADGHYAKWFEGIVKQVDSTYLTAALTQIAEQRADHYRIQKHFVETYATLSLVSYLFGVGDRHLSNFLSDHKSGEVISIDFGHAFGTATTTLPVPELVPFRLTPQIQAVQGVMGGGVSALHMTTVLRTLRRYRSSLEGITSSFTSEPLLQWKAANISPDQMMASITRKLNLENPCTLMYELAKHNTFMRDAKQLPGIKEALYNGRSEARSVSEKSQQCESEENFVECLIDMATDYNLIGRIYHGWMPMF